MSDRQGPDLRAVHEHGREYLENEWLVDAKAFAESFSRHARGPLGETVPALRCAMHQR